MSMLFGPQGLILLGAILATVGAFWSSQQQADFERKLNAKNEELLTVTQDTLSNITGGDSFSFASPLFIGGDNQFQLLVTNFGKFDLHDLDIQLSSGRRDIFPVGTTPVPHFMVPDMYQANIPLKRLAKRSGKVVDFVILKPGAHYDYAINFHSRNGQVHQRLRVRQFNKKWEFASFARRGPNSVGTHGEILRVEKSEGFDLKTLEEKWPQKVGEVFLH